MRAHLLYIAIAAGVLWGCSSPKHPDHGEFEFSTAAESKERAGRVLSPSGTEDVSHLLTLNKEPIKPEPEPDSTRYFASNTYDWIICIDPIAPFFSRDEVNGLFTREWMSENGSPTLYAIPKDSAYWSYFPYGYKEVNELQRIALAWKLYEDLESPPTIYSQERLSQLEASVKERISELGAKEPTYNLTLSEAAETSKKLAQFVPTNNKWCTIVLQADDYFDGKEVWDVMMSIGLEWGDMDLFHWNNTHPAGDDQYLSVWTSTAPGYFFPEEIAAGRVRTDDLIFGFSIPRSIDPKDVFSVLLETSKYAQKRLGGQLLNGKGQQLDPEIELHRIEKITTNLSAESMSPGDGDALYLF